MAVIQRTPGVCGGKACVGNSRIKVSTIVQWFRDGADIRKVYEAYPSLSYADIVAARVYAQEHLDEIQADIDEDALLTTEAILERAKQNIIQSGWMRNEMGSRVIGYCLAGALIEAAEVTARPNAFTPELAVAIEKISNVLPPSRQTGVGKLTIWNDRTAVNVLEVLDVIRKAQAA